jgi:hypothetical protein
MALTHTLGINRGCACYICRTDAGLALGVCGRCLLGKNFQTKPNQVPLFISHWFVV